MALEVLTSSSSCSELEAGNDTLEKTKDVKCEFLLEAKMSKTLCYSVAE